MSQRIGYGRVSKRDQNPDSQHDALYAAFAYARADDVLVVTRLSRAARSLKNLIELAELLAERGIELVVLKQGIDTTTPAERLPSSQSCSFGNHPASATTDAGTGSHRSGPVRVFSPRPALVLGRLVICGW